MTSRAALGAGALACALIGAAPLSAACSAANQYSYSFTTAPAATLNYAGSYSYTATSTALGNQAFTVSFTTNGTTSTQINGNQMPAITTLINDGGTTNRNLMVGGTFAGRTANVAGATRVIVTRFTFAVPIRDFTVQVNDVDFAVDQYRDWLQVTGSNGAATYIPSIVTPFGNNNTVPGPHTAAGSTMTIGATTTPYALTQSQATGTSTSGNNDDAGTLTASFVQPVTVVELRYGNFPYSGTDDAGTGQQAYGIQRLGFCPMPQLTAVKSSTPYVTAATDPARFNIPGADVIYAITLANTGGSAAELNGVVMTDVLPANMTYYNGDFDGAGPVVGPFDIAFGGGTTVSTGIVEFSNNGGSSYGYTPGAGYDAAVDAIRMSATGTVPPGGSATVRFRARIN